MLHILNINNVANIIQVRDSSRYLDVVDLAFCLLRPFEYWRQREREGIPYLDKVCYVAAEQC